MKMLDLLRYLHNGSFEIEILTKNVFGLLPIIKNMDDGGFPETHLYELESRVFTDQWSIPYKKDESLHKCLLAAAKLMEEGKFSLLIKLISLTKCSMSLIQEPVRMTKTCRGS